MKLWINACLHTSQWTHLRRFVIDSTSKFLVESSWKLHQFWKAKPRGNYDIDSTWIFQRGFHFQNGWNIDEFSSWTILCRFDVKPTQLLYSLFPFYHFLTFSALGTYSKLFWYNTESLQFQWYWRNHSFWNYWNYILLSNDKFHFLQNNTNRDRNANIYN